jgi:hypothetical protein
VRVGGGILDRRCEMKLLATKIHLVTALVLGLGVIAA